MLLLFAFTIVFCMPYRPETRAAYNCVILVIPFPSQPFMPLLDTPRIMYLRRKTKIRNSGIETIVTAAI